MWCSKFFAAEQPHPGLLYTLSMLLTMQCYIVAPISNRRKEIDIGGKKLYIGGKKHCMVGKNFAWEEINFM